MKSKLEKKTEKLLLKAQNAYSKLSDYPEHHSEKTVLEIWIFNVCCLLLKEHDEKLIELVLSDLINGIHSCDTSGMDIEDIANHVFFRTKFYQEIFKSILQNPVEYDLKPLYCAWFRYPFTDVQYAVAEPADPRKFRLAVSNMMDWLYR